MKWLSALFIVLLCSVASAEILAGPITQSGDAGDTFADTLSKQMCKNADVQAVFICNGNVVKVTYKDKVRGSTFYKPDGAVLNCPNVSASKMGAACVQMFLPNVCAKKVVCGSAPTLPFPGQKNTSPTVTPTPTPTPQPVPTPVPTPTPQPTTPQPTPQPTPSTPTPTTNTTTPTTPTQTQGDNTLALIMVVVGILLVAGINFFYFRSKGK